jgi:hypothetical protein
VLRRICVLATLIFAGNVVAGVVPSNAAAACSMVGTYASELNVYYGPWGGYEYRVEGTAYVSNPAARAGCNLIVCEAEELGAGNWVPAWCNVHDVAAHVQWYYSQVPYIDCENYNGTGWFRSYARYEGGGVISMGPPRYVCT